MIDLPLQAFKAYLEEISKAREINAAAESGDWLHLRFEQIENGIPVLGVEVATES